MQENAIVSSVLYFTRKMPFFLAFSLPQKFKMKTPSEMAFFKIKKATSFTVLEIVFLELIQKKKTLFWDIFFAMGRTFAPLLPRGRPPTRFHLSQQLMESSSGENSILTRVRIATKRSSFFFILMSHSWQWHVCFYKWKIAPICEFIAFQ